MNGGMSVAGFRRVRRNEPWQLFRPSLRRASPGHPPYRACRPGWRYPYRIPYCSPNSRTRKECRHVQPLPHGLTDPAVPFCRAFVRWWPARAVSPRRGSAFRGSRSPRHQRAGPAGIFSRLLFRRARPRKVLPTMPSMNLPMMRSSGFIPTSNSNARSPWCYALPEQGKGREGRAFVHENELFPDHLPIDHLDELSHTLPDILVVGLPLHRCADAGFRPFVV